MAITQTELAEKKCAACAPGMPALSPQAAQDLLKTVPGWQMNTAGTEISRAFEFKNFHFSMGFANAIAWIANAENHHPDLELGYKRCLVKYSTHAVNGLSENDFICAAKINKLVG